MILAAHKSELVTIPPEIASKALVRLGTPQSFSAPLMQAGIDGELDIVIIAEPSAIWPGRFLRNTQRPTVVLIPDDPGGLDGCGGAGAWSCALHLATWCRAAIVHAAGGEKEHYEAARDATLAAKRVVVIETASAHAAAWISVLPLVPKLIILSTDGPHPVERVLH